MRKKFCEFQPWYPNFWRIPNFCKAENKVEWSLKIRPCERQKFPNFLFSRVSEMFGFQSSENFRKYPVFSNSWKFREKVRKKVRKLKFGNNFEYYSNFTSNTKILKKLCKIWGFRSKNPVFRSKCLEKSSKKVLKFRILVFPNVWKFRRFRKFGNSKLSENYEKMTFNSKFENREKLVPTRKLTRKFG